MGAGPSSPSRTLATTALAAPLATTALAAPLATTALAAPLATTALAATLSTTRRTFSTTFCHDNDLLDAPEPADWRRYCRASGLILGELKMTDRGNVETHAPSAARTLQSVLSRPFEHLTLQRAMQLFPTALSLAPGSAGLPSDDFLANFLTGRRTHLAMVRHGFGVDFRNFQNYALKRVETTPAVRRRLVQALNGNEELLEVMADAMRDGALASALAELTRAAEGVLYQVVRALSSGSLKCVHCKAEMVSRPARWWGMQSCVLGEAEYRFVDRLLCDVLAVSLLGVAFRVQSPPRDQALSSLAGLCAPGAHPFKHWLDLVREPYRAKDLTALATRARLDGPSPDNHLQRCSRGEMLTVETIDNLTKHLERPANLRNLGMQARVLAFTIDFLVAAQAGPDCLGWDAAQAIVKARIEQLSTDMRLSFAAVERQSKPGMGRI